MKLISIVIIFFALSFLVYKAEYDFIPPKIKNTRWLEALAKTIIIDFIIIDIIVLSLIFGVLYAHYGSQFTLFLLFNAL